LGIKNKHDIGTTNKWNGFQTGITLKAKIFTGFNFNRLKIPKRTIPKFNKISMSTNI
jgi:hypothetical protein